MKVEKGIYIWRIVMCGVTTFDYSINKNHSFKLGDISLESFNPKRNYSKIRAMLTYDLSGVKLKDITSAKKLASYICEMLEREHEMFKR